MASSSDAKVTDMLQIEKIGVRERLIPISEVLNSRESLSMIHAKGYEHRVDSTSMDNE
jgi:hypothetical protein